jgi:hypothetical protein
MTHHRKAFLAIALLGLAPPAFADVVSDWNDQAVAFGVNRKIGPPPAERIIAMTQVAMSDAVNSIARKYKPYLVQLPTDADTSREAAAAAAAGTVLAGINPQAQPEMKAVLANYIETIPDSPAKAAGIRLGEYVVKNFMQPVAVATR